MPSFSICPSIRSGRAAFATLCLTGCLVGCTSEKKDQITLQVGPEQVLHFEVESGFAQYYELPGHGDVLRIILASYPLGCQKYVPPSPGEVFVTVTLRVPPDESLEPGEYSWKGLILEEPKEGEEPAPPEVEALPFVRLAEDARALPPGGHVKLTTFVPERFGVVAGKLAFRDAEAGQAANTALMGDFTVRLCHADLDPARRAPPSAQ